MSDSLPPIMSAPLPSMSLPAPLSHDGRQLTVPEPEPPSREPTPAPSGHTVPPVRISLVDNTAPPSLGDSPSDDSEAPHRGKRSTIRKAIAQRKYKKWSAVPDEAEGVVVGREDQESAEDAGANGPRDGYSTRKGVIDEGAVRSIGRSTGPWGAGRWDGKGRPSEISEIDVLYENQRGYVAPPVVATLRADVTKSQLLHLRHPALFVEIAPQL